MGKKRSAAEQPPTLDEIRRIPGFAAWEAGHRERMKNYTGPKARRRISWDIIGPHLWRWWKQQDALAAAIRAEERERAERDIYAKLLALMAPKEEERKPG
jgi:hypothetical protein